MSDLPPQMVIARLAEIDADLQSRQNEYEKAARDFARQTRELELHKAKAFMQAEGPVEQRKQEAILAMSAPAPGEDMASTPYALLKDAEARYEGCKVAVRVLETRASIGQSILRAQGRA
jgi:hypothetical protein